jgi:methylenetetrahydrofolate reductase (NADPH)
MIAGGMSEEPRREALSRFARGASIETSARTAAEVDSYASLLASGTRVYVAWIPGAARGHALDLSRRLKQAGLRPVPHIAARELASREAAERLIGELGQSGIDSALVIAGDRPDERGPYADSIALLQTGLFELNGITRLGFAGYPEGHARVALEALAAALDAKLRYAASHGIEPFIVSQFCFDAAAILEWLGGLRARGVRAPVHVGMAGPAKIGTLIKYGMRCGIGNSLRALNAHAKQVTQLLSSQGPEPVAGPVALADASLGIAGWHFFAFGGFARTARWIQSVASGEIDLTEGGGFGVRVS